MRNAVLRSNFGALHKRRFCSRYLKMTEPFRSCDASQLSVVRSCVVRCVSYLEKGAKEDRRAEVSRTLRHAFVSYP